MSQETAGDLRTNALSIKKIAYISIFTALSAVGALIKLPSPVGTIGLDSAPGYFSAIAFGYREGIAVIAIGHMLTSAIVGFPLGLPLHIFIAVLMALWSIVYRWIGKKLGVIVGSIIVVALNGVLSSFTMVFVGGMGAVLGVMPFLVAGSLANIVIASVAYKAISRSKLI
jgi:uncharacterized membrane protein